MTSGRTRHWSPDFASPILWKCWVSVLNSLAVLDMGWSQVVLLCLIPNPTLECDQPIEYCSRRRYTLLCSDEEYLPLGSENVWHLRSTGRQGAGWQECAGWCGKQLWWGDSPRRRRRGGLWERALLYKWTYTHSWACSRTAYDTCLVARSRVAHCTLYMLCFYRRSGNFRR